MLKLNTKPNVVTKVKPLLASISDKSTYKEKIIKEKFDNRFTFDFLYII